MMNKQLAAIGAAVLMTACTAGAILAIGGVAMFDRAGVTPASSPSVAASEVSDASLVSQTQVQQLQVQLSQYQAREQQYQTRERQYQQALAQSQSDLVTVQQQAQQMQLFLLALQQRGQLTQNDDSSPFGEH
jgi:hypothetical protein